METTALMNTYGERSVTLVKGEGAWLWDNSGKKYLDNQFNPNGFNVGINCGESAGQTVAHAHIHLIPRYEGDVEDPTGGVRGVIPLKQKY